MKDFEYFAPRSLAEAHTLLQEFGPDAKVIAGGTALTLLMKRGLVQPPCLVSLRLLPGLDDIAISDGKLRLGALCTHRQVETSPLVRQQVPLLAEVFRQVATVRIRHMATLGGALAHADPNQDSLTALLALGARALLSSAQGQRELPLEEFFLDYYETALKPNELVQEIRVPLPGPGSAAAFLKFLPRTADDYATVSVAVALRLEDGACREARIALGSAGPTPIRARKAEAELAGRTLDNATIASAAAIVRDEVDPLDDIRGSAAYKREMAAVFTRRALLAALAGGPHAG